MTTFEDGPAKGQTLTLIRAMISLRLLRGQLINENQET